MDASLFELQEQVRTTYREDWTHDLDEACGERLFALVHAGVGADPAVVIYRKSDPTGFHRAVQDITAENAIAEEERTAFHSAFMQFLNETHTVTDLVSMVTTFMEESPEFDIDIRTHLTMCAVCE
jgi:hypothetical protein